MKRHVSLGIRNFNSQTIKVNDLNGNPIEIAAVVVWRVVDSARALFDVENYEQFAAIQSGTAIRALASEYPYDAHDEDRLSRYGAAPRKSPTAFRGRCRPVSKWRAWRSTSRGLLFIFKSNSVGAHDTIGFTGG